MARKSKKKTLTRLELEVMRVLWEHEPVPVRTVLEHMNESRKKKLAYNTVQTVLTILKGKGVVAARKGQGRAHLYLSKASQEEVAASMVHDLTERLYDGRIAPVLLHLVESETLSPSARAELKSWIEEHLDDEEDAE